MPGPSKVIVLDPDARAGRQVQLGFSREGVPTALAAVDGARLELPADETALVIVGGTDGRALDLLRRVRLFLDEKKLDVPIVFNGRGVRRTDAEAAGADEVVMLPAFLRDVVTIGRLLRGQPADKRDHLVGSLAETTGVFTLVRALAALGRSAVLTLIRGLRRGEIRFFHGEVTSAQVGLIHGQAAFHQLLLWTEARFEFAHEDVVRRHQIPLSPEELFVDAERFLEGVRDSSGKLSPSMVLEQDVARVQALGKQIPTEVHGVLRMFDGHRVLADILEDSPYRVFETLRVAQRACDVGLLRIVDGQRPKAKWRAVLAIEEWLVGSDRDAIIQRNQSASDSGPLPASRDSSEKVKGGKRKRKKRRANTPPATPAVVSKPEIDWGALVPRVVGAEVGPLSGVVPASHASGEIELPTRGAAREKLEALMDTEKRERIFPKEVGLEPKVVFDEGEDLAKLEKEKAAAAVKARADSEARELAAKQIRERDEATTRAKTDAEAQTAAKVAADKAAADKPANKSAPDKPADKSAPDKQADTSPADKSADRSAPDKSADRSAADKPSAKSAADKSSDKSAADRSAADKPSAKSAADKSSDKSAADRSAADKPAVSAAPDDDAATVAVERIDLDDEGDTDETPSAAKPGGSVVVAATKAIDTAAIAVRAAADRAAVDKAAAIKIPSAADKAAADKAAAIKIPSAADAKAAAEKAAADKLAADKAAADKLVADKLAADKAAADKSVADKAAADKLAADKAAADKLAADKAVADKAAADKAAADKLAADKLAADKAAADKAASDKLTADARAAEDARLAAESKARADAAAEKLAAEAKARADAVAEKIASEAKANAAAEKAGGGAKGKAAASAFDFSDATGPTPKADDAADGTKADATKADATKADATKADGTKADATKAAGKPDASAKADAGAKTGDNGSALDAAARLRAEAEARADAEDAKLRAEAAEWAKQQAAARANAADQQAREAAELTQRLADAKAKAEAANRPRPPDPDDSEARAKIALAELDEEKKWREAKARAGAADADAEDAKRAAFAVGDTVSTTKFEKVADPLLDDENRTQVRTPGVTISESASATVVVHDTLTIDTTANTARVTSRSMASITSSAPEELADEPSDGIIREIANVDTKPVRRPPPGEIPPDDRPGARMGEISNAPRGKRPTDPKTAEPSILVGDIAAAQAAVSAVVSAQAAAPASQDIAAPVRELAVAEVRKDAVHAFSDAEEEFFRAGADKTGKVPLLQPPTETFDDLDEGYQPQGFWDRLRGKKPTKPTKK